MPVIMCRTLGPMQVTVDDVPAPQALLWKKPLGLLLYLLRSPRRTRSREHLVGLLWPEVAESSARHSLNETLSKLRRTAGEDAVESSGDLVTLGPRFECDLDEFEAAMAQGDWAAASALCAGELAEGLVVPGALDFDQWLEVERRHWRSQGVLALSNWAQRLLDQGRTRTAVDAAHRALALDPLSERALQGVLRARLLLGDRRGALEAGREFVHRLTSELGAEPGAETVALLAQAVPSAREAGGRWTDDTPRIPLVGREGELSALLALFERTRAAREASLAVVVGEPGAGVSRLLLELLARARMAGASTARVVAVNADREERWSGVAGLALGGLLAAPGIAAAPASSLGALAERLVPWRDRFGATSGALPDLPDVALAEVVAAAADEHPVVLVLDDAHRLDEETLRALPRMLRRWRELPVLVVVGTSPLEERAALDEIRMAAGRDVPGLALQVGPLTVNAIRELAALLLPTYGPVELGRVVRRVVTDSAGVPLLALELLNAVARGLELSGSDKAWPSTLATLEDSLPGDLPDAIVAAIRVNFRRLSRESRDVLAAAAVLADRTSAAELARATGLPAPAVEDALDELEWHHWLSSDGRGYSFVARLGRRVVGEEMLTSGQRRRLLERVRGAEGGSEDA
jgi:DNA-binding SARP family transcriptional activator